MTIGDLICELRKARGISRPELARRTKVSRVHVWGIETGRFVPGLATLEKLSDALSVGLSRLFSQSSAEFLLEDAFIRAVHSYLRHLNHEQKQHLLKTMRAAPQQGRRGNMTDTREKKR